MLNAGNVQIRGNTFNIHKFSSSTRFSLAGARARSHSQTNCPNRCMFTRKMNIVEFLYHLFRFWTKSQCIDYDCIGLHKFCIDMHFIRNTFQSDAGIERRIEKKNRQKRKKISLSIPGNDVVKPNVYTKTKKSRHTLTHSHTKNPSPSIKNEATEGERFGVEKQNAEFIVSIIIFHTKLWQKINDLFDKRYNYNFKLLILPIRLYFLLLWERFFSWKTLFFVQSAFFVIFSILFVCFSIN